MPNPEAAVLTRHDSASTVAGMRRALTETFRAAEIDLPELDARVLVGHALSLDHSALTAAGERLLNTAERETILRIRAAPAGTQTGRAHHRQQRILELETLC